MRVEYVVLETNQGGGTVSRQKEGDHRRERSRGKGMWWKGKRVVEAAEESE